MSTTVRQVELLSAPTGDGEGGTGVKSRRGRPAGRSPTRAGLIQKGIEILTEQGFASTGIEAVLRETGVPKGSFYHYFSSKEAFGLAVIDAYARHYDEKLDRLFGDDSVPPFERFGNFLAEARRGMRKHDYRRGCLIGNLGQEFGCGYEIFAVRLSAVLKDWQRTVAACLEAARKRGELAVDAEPKRLAELFWIGWEGAVMRARLERSCRPLELFMEFYLAHLRQA